MPGETREVAADTQPPTDQHQDQDGAADLAQAHRQITPCHEAAVVDLLHDQAIDPRSERAQDGAGRDEQVGGQDDPDRARLGQPPVAPVDRAGRQTGARRWCW